MSEEALNVKVIPEIDQESIQNLVEQMSGAVVNFTGKISGSSKSGGDGEAENEVKESTADAINEGLDKVSKNETTLGKLMAPLTQNQKEASKFLGEMDGTAKDNAQNGKEQTSVFGKISEGLAFGVGFAVAGWGIVKKIFNIIASSEGPLKEVLGLFSTIFGLFLLPLNIALTQILIPYVQELASSMGTWVSEMMKVYEEDGLGGIIVATFGKLVAVFLPMLMKMVEYTGTVILTVLRQIWNSGMLAKAVMVLAVAVPIAWVAMQAWNAVKTTQLTMMNAELIALFTNRTVSLVLEGTRTAALLAVVTPILVIAGVILAIFEIISFLSTGKGFFANIFGFAEGGVFEPNDEKIIKIGDNTKEQEIVAPKSTIVSAVNEALDSNTNITNSSSVGQSVTINATFNITNDDPEAVAKEVEKQLSKMMDNSTTRWGV